MIDPFDAEFLSQELRDSWKKIQELEEENKIVKKENKELEETRQRLVKYTHQLERDLGFYKPNSTFVEANL